MFVPAHNDRLMNSAARVNADVLLLDIEDSVQPASNKQVARDNILRYIADGTFRGRVLYPRVNDRESGELLRDVYQLTVEGITGFMYPKSKKGEDIYFFGKLLETIEYEKGFPIGTFKIIPLIETTGAVMNIQEICNACPNRVTAVAFGAKISSPTSAANTIPRDRAFSRPGPRSLWVLKRAGWFRLTRYISMFMISKTLNII